MQIQKLIKKAFEDMIKQNMLSYEIKKDKKGSYFSIEIMPKNISAFEKQRIEIEIYHKYLVLNIGGWKYYEKTDTEEEIEQLQSLQILQKFFNKEMKIKIYYRNTHPYFWKAYLFKKYFWEFYKQNSAFFRRFFSFKKPVLNEISIEIFLNLNKGAVS